MAERGIKRRLVGTVVSNKTDKTALVMVERQTKHPIYKKYVRRRAKHMAHDPHNACQIGDKVKITESRPMSKQKRWRISEILGKATEVR